MDKKEEYEIQATEYQRMQFQKLRKLITSDLNDAYANNSVLLKKYSKEQIERYLLTPDKNVKELQEMSEFLYITSPHYKRLIDYLSQLSCNYYVLNSTEYLVDDTVEYKKKYFDVANRYKRVSFKNINPIIKHEVLLRGIYCGIAFESKNSFCLKELNSSYCAISSVEDGSLFFSFNLDYFNTKARMTELEQLGNDFITAYYEYKGDPKRGIPADKNKKWFEPKNQICVKADCSTLQYSLPYFIGLFTAILDVDVYKEIKKDKAIMDNYKVLAMKMDTNEYGVPTMPFKEAMKYYNQAASCLPEGVGLIMTPFGMEDFSLQNSANTDNDLAESATNQFWNNAGVSPLLFGIASPSAEIIKLSIKSDELIVFTMDANIAKAFNTRYKKENNDYEFLIGFLPVSNYNQKDVVDMLTKLCSYGLPFKSQLMAAAGLEPWQVLSASYLEDTVLKFTKDCLNTPLLQSSTMSPDSETGRPTNAESGKTDADNTDKDRNHG